LACHQKAFNLPFLIVSSKVIIVNSNITTYVSIGDLILGYNHINYDSHNYVLG